MESRDPISGTDADWQPGITPASEEIINLLAQAPDVLNFRPSEQARARVWELVAREKEGTLTQGEMHELEHYAQIEHLMRLVKAQARKRVHPNP